MYEHMFVCISTSSSSCCLGLSPLPHRFSLRFWPKFEHSRLTGWLLIFIFAFIITLIYVRKSLNMQMQMIKMYEHMYVWVYICMYVCMYVCMYEYIRVCTHLHFLPPLLLFLLSLAFPIPRHWRCTSCALLSIRWISDECQTFIMVVCICICIGMYVYVYVYVYVYA